MPPQLFILDVHNRIPAFPMKCETYLPGTGSRFPSLRYCNRKTWRPFGLERLSTGCEQSVNDGHLSCVFIILKNDFILGQTFSGFWININDGGIKKVQRTVPHGLIKELENECGLPFDQRCT